MLSCNWSHSLDVMDEMLETGLASHGVIEDLLEDSERVHVVQHWFEADGIGGPLEIMFTWTGPPFFRRIASLSSRKVDADKLKSRDENAHILSLGPLEVLNL